MKNGYTIEEDVVKIHIHRLNGEYFEALVSPEDFNKVAYECGDVSWCINDCRSGRGGVYAYCRIPGTKPQQNISMHRVLAGAAEGDLVDHINGNTLDNRRGNLRLTTHLGNNHNRTRINRNNTSGFKGVAWHGQQNKWRAYVMVDHSQVHLGCYDNQAEAAEAVVSYKRKFFHESPEAMEAA